MTAYVPTSNTYLSPGGSKYHALAAAENIRARSHSPPPPGKRLFLYEYESKDP